MFNLLRHFAITSFVGMVVAAVLLTALYRRLEIQESTELVQRNDSALAENVVNSMRPELSDYLASVSKFGPRDIADVRFPAALASLIAESMKRTSIAQVKVYNDLGVVVFSTQPGETGTIEANRSGFVAASSGNPATDLHYFDAFNRFGQRASGDNLAQTYVPVQRTRSDPIRGVLVISTDLSPMVARNEHEVLTVIVGVASILAVLYCVLLVTVLRAQKIIEAQQATIRERTRSLETLSAQMLDNEETEKKNLAMELHEELAQTLSAVKIRIEDGLDPAKAKQLAAEPLKSAVSALRGVVEELQHTAMELRPSSLDELGLLPTIHWYCREAEQLHAGLRIDRQISVQENEIPGSLKIAIYRIIETVLKDVAGCADTDRVQLALGLSDNTLTLAIDQTVRATADGMATPRTGSSDPRLRFVLAQERTTLSGGEFSVETNRYGGIALHAQWTVSTESPGSRHDLPDIGSLGYAA